MSGRSNTESLPDYKFFHCHLLTADLIYIEKGGGVKNILIRVWRINGLSGVWEFGASRESGVGNRQ